MEKLEVFVSKHCPDCAPVRAYLEARGIAHEYIDVSEDILSLKRFIRYRDKLAAFDPVKEAGNIGLPCFIYNEGERALFELEEI